MRQSHGIKGSGDPPPCTHSHHARNQKKNGSGKHVRHSSSKRHSWAKALSIQGSPISVLLPCGPVSRSSIATCYSSQVTIGNDWLTFNVHFVDAGNSLTMFCSYKVTAQSLWWFLWDARDSIYLLWIAKFCGMTFYCILRLNPIRDWIIVFLIVKRPRFQSLTRTGYLHWDLQYQVNLLLPPSPFLS